MMQLHQELDEFMMRDTIVVAIGPENAKAFEKYWAQNGLGFIGLPDEKLVVLKRYGQEVNLFKLGRMPAQMIIDKQGVLRFVHYGHSMQDIPSNAELFGLIDGM